MRGITKSFPGVRALQGVDLTLNRGEILALLGENGAGKSTLMRVLGGAHPADAGTLSLEGHRTEFRNPMEARHAGVAVIYQEFNLVPSLSAVENIFLGRERSRFGFVTGAEEFRAARAHFERLGADLDPGAACRTLTTAQQQLVEIAKALAQEAKILVMDEPTAALTTNEVERLFAIIRDLRQQGIGIIYISHRLDEIERIADRITVLRDGQNVGNARVGEISRTALIGMMVGRELKDEFPPRSAAFGNIGLEVSGLHRGHTVRDVSFSVRRGEILAMTGLIGAGRTETARLIFGADPRDRGEIRLDGRVLDIRSPRDAIRAGIGLLTEDRKLQGLVLRHSVLENFGLPNLDRFSRRGFLTLGRERSEFLTYSRRLGIRVPGDKERAGNLSGGNQQKIVLAKWLARNCEVLIFDEPTRGIDVGAKYEIYLLMNELAAAGKALIMISSELPEVLGMADRILVMRQGRIAGEIHDSRRATQEQILHLAVA
ncbi:MAG: sugar ABC transporter ATP-binding protein [Verrucomicrobiota bacterium]